jgi:hypothetical protein
MADKITSIGSILSNRFDKLKLIDPQKQRPTNWLWEEAKEFGEYVGISTAFVMRLIKMFGKAKVFGLRSWLKDLQYDKRGKYGLIMWKLKQYAQTQKDQETKKTNPIQAQEKAGHPLQSIHPSQRQEVSKLR